MFSHFTQVGGLYKGKQHDAPTNSNSEYRRVLRLASLHSWAATTSTAGSGPAICGVVYTTGLERRWAMLLGKTQLSTTTASVCCFRRLLDLFMNNAKIASTARMTIETAMTSPAVRALSTDWFSMAPTVVVTEANGGGDNGASGGEGGEPGAPISDRCTTSCTATSFASTAELVAPRHEEPAST